MNIIILGAGAFAREVYDWCIQSYDGFRNQYNVVGFFSGVYGDTNTLRGLPIYYNVDEIPYDNINWVVGTGNVIAMRSMLDLIGNKIPACEAIVHPSCVLGSNVTIGDGSIICPNVVITCNVSVGFCVAINISCTVGHDCIIGDLVHIAPNSSLSGFTKIGNNCEIGTSVVTIPHVTVVDKCIIGAKALVTKDLLISGTYTGIPAKLRI